jgi:rod shape determining protein RodA
MKNRLTLSFDLSHWTTLVLTLLLSIIGILFIYSTTHNSSDSHLFIKQILWLILATFILLLISSYDYHKLIRFAPILYFILIVSLALLTLLGSFFGGARSWFFLKYLAIQPSELGKIITILFMAKLFSELDRPQLYFKDIIKPAILLGIPVALIAIQPDMGTALTYIPIFLGMLFVGRLRTRVIVVLVILLVIFVFLTWSFVLKPYQKDRITTFMNPEEYKQGSGYQIYQSKIAIGSGGFWGKGYLKGTQSQLKFVPEQHTDFIFSVLAEETGLVGVTITMGLYLALFLSLFNTTLLARDKAGLFIAAGFVSLLGFHFFINVGMVVGLMPTTGIPLPLISYGGSSLLSTYIGIGILINIRSKRFVNI